MPVQNSVEVYDVFLQLEQKPADVMLLSALSITQGLSLPLNVHLHNIKCRLLMTGSIALKAPLKEITLVFEARRKRAGSSYLSNNPPGLCD